MQGRYWYTQRACTVPSDTDDRYPLQGTSSVPQLGFYRGSQVGGFGVKVKPPALLVSAQQLISSMMLRLLLILPYPKLPSSGLPYLRSTHHHHHHDHHFGITISRAEQPKSCDSHIDIMSISRPTCRASSFTNFSQAQSPSQGDPSPPRLASSPF